MLPLDCCQRIAMARPALSITEVAGIAVIILSLSLIGYVVFFAR
jgi:hypothetical protein